MMIRSWVGTKVHWGLLGDGIRGHAGKKDRINGSNHAMALCKSDSEGDLKNLLRLLLATVTIFTFYIRLANFILPSWHIESSSLTRDPTHFFHRPPNPQPMFIIQQQMYPRH